MKLCFAIVVGFTLAASTAGKLRALQNPIAIPTTAPSPTTPSPTSLPTIVQSDQESCESYLHCELIEGTGPSSEAGPQSTVLNTAGPPPSFVASGPFYIYCSYQLNFIGSLAFTYGENEGVVVDYFQYGEVALTDTTPVSVSQPNYHVDVGLQYLRYPCNEMKTVQVIAYPVNSDTTEPCAEVTYVMENVCPPYECPPDSQSTVEGQPQSFSDCQCDTNYGPSEEQTCVCVTPEEYPGCVVEAKLFSFGTSHVYAAQQCPTELSYCADCLEGYYHFGNECLAECPTGYHPVGGSCEEVAATSQPTAIPTTPSPTTTSPTSLPTIPTTVSPELPAWSSLPDSNIEVAPPPGEDQPPSCMISDFLRECKYAKHCHYMYDGVVDCNTDKGGICVCKGNILCGCMEQR